MIVCYISFCYIGWTQSTLLEYRDIILGLSLRNFCEIALNIFPKKIFPSLVVNFLTSHSQYCDVCFKCA